MSDLVGQCVGRYRIERLVRHHAMYSVYSASDPDLGRMVWIGVQKWVAGQPIGYTLLRSEATALAQLHHPGIVQVHDVGTHAGGFYVVSEQLSGGTLAAAFAAKSLRVAAV